MNLNEPATVILTVLGANVLNANNEEFNEKFKRELKTDYKEGDTYENLLLVILHHFSDYYEDPFHIPFTNLEKAS